MLMKTFLLFLGLIVTMTTAMAQPHPDTLWTSRIGGSEIDYVHALVQSDDGGYLLAGESVSYGDHVSDAYMVKLNSGGGQQWYRTYGYYNQFTTNAFTAVQQTTDHGYILVGKTNIPNWNYAYAVRTNVNGDSLWTRMFYDPRSSIDLWAQAVLQTPDNGFLIAGYAASATPHSYICLIRLAANGDTLWTHFMRSRESTAFETCDAMARSPEGGYVLAGRRWTSDFTTADALLVKSSEAGEVEWSRSYGEGNADAFHAVAATADGGYVLAGESYVDVSHGIDIYVVRTTSSGDTVWTRRIGGSSEDIAKSVQEAGGNVIIGAETASSGAGSHDLCLIKLDGNGNQLWSRTYGGSDYEICDAMQKTTDGGYVLAGATQSFGAQSFDGYVIKTGPDSAGSTCPLLCDDAYPIAVNETVSQCRFHNSGESHWFQIHLTTGLYRFQLNGFSNPADYDLYTYVSCATPTDCRGLLVGPEDFQCQVAAEMDLFVEVDAYSGPYGSYWLRIDRVEKAAENAGNLPKNFGIYSFPNPFNAVTTLRYDVKTTSHVTLAVFDLNGRTVAVLKDGMAEAGSYQVRFDGQALPSGVYFARFNAGTFSQTHKLMLLK
jgi:hypothetical protein